MSYRKVFHNLKLQNKYVPKSHQPHVFFPNSYIRLHIPSVLERTRVVQFYIPLEMTKPELRSQLENYYNIDNIEKIHTTIKMGRKRKSRKTGRPVKKDADEKKAYVYLTDYVELDFTDEMKKEIMRFYDPTRNKEYWEERERMMESEEMQQRMQQFQQQQQQEQQQQQQAAAVPALESSASGAAGAEKRD